jgi:pimeloyl-ACP methyl ester carboxylesterase
MFGFYILEILVLRIIATSLTGKIWLVIIITIKDDVVRFMFENQISMATMGGHGLGGKIALATACYHLNKTTGYFGIASSPMSQYYFEAAR